MKKILCLKLSMLAIVLLSSPFAEATTYYVSPSGSDGNDGLSASKAWKTLAYACDIVPAGSHTIKLAAGTYVASKTAYVKSGISIEGSGKSSTFIKADAAWVSVGGLRDHMRENYVIAIVDKDNIVIKDIHFSSADNAKRRDGAIWCSWSDNIEVANCHFEEFSWTGAYFREVSGLNFHHSEFLNACQIREVTNSGNLHTRYLENSEIHHNNFKTTYVWVMGIKLVVTKM